MKVSELTRLLKKNKCKLLRHGSSHDIWWNPQTGGQTSLPRHPSKEIPNGTVNKILEELDLK